MKIKITHQDFKIDYLNLSTNVGTRFKWLARGFKITLILYSTKSHSNQNNKDYSKERKVQTVYQQKLWFREKKFISYTRVTK